jgi:capsular exopolysaccharide synthesis family protein
MSDPVNGELVSTPGGQPAPGRLMLRGPSMYAGAVPARSNQSALVWDLLKALYRRWRQAAVFGVLAALAVGFVVWYFLPPPLPSATAKLYVPSIPNPKFVQHPDRPMDRGTQIALVKNTLVLTAALRAPGINELPVIQKLRQDGQQPEDWLLKNLVVDFSEGPEILRISLSLDDPDQAKKLVDAVKKSYLEEIVNRSLRERRDRLEGLQKLVTQTKNAYDRQLANAAQAAGESVTGFDEKNFLQDQKFTQDQLTQANSELLRTKSDIRRLQQEEIAYKTRGSKGVELPEQVLENYVTNDDEVKRSALEKTALEARIKDIKERLVNPEQSEQYKAAMADLEEHKKRHEKVRAEARERIVDRFRTTTAADAAIKLRNVQELLINSIAFEKSLQVEVDAYAAKLEKMRKGNRNLEPIRLEVKQAADLYTKVKGAHSTLELEMEADSRVLELEPARITAVDVDRRKQFFAGIGALAALAGVLAMVGLREVRLRRVESPDSVADDLGLPIVGMIPRHPSRLARTYGRDDASWQAGLIESINCTRTMLLHGEGLNSIKVVQITSPVSGEGKTTLATHLALSVALAGRRTLLIDGDLRNPNAHRPFNLADGPGLCEVLRGEAVLADTLLTTSITGLSVMPGGRWADGTQQAMASEGLDVIFAQVRAEFDFVVVDSSPVLPLTDPLLLARHADGVIVSLMQGVSRLPLVQEANQRMAVLGVRVLGAVLNGTANRRYGYGGRYASPVTV